MTSTEIITSTESGSRDEQTTATSFSWQHQITSQVSFRITSRTSLSFVEFLTCTLGSISTWTGFSVFACNPLKSGRALSSLVKSRAKSQDVQESKPRIIQTCQRYHSQLHNLSRNTIPNGQWTRVSRFRN